MSDTPKRNEAVAWPQYVMLRDTELHDDMGGLGQRIYTTAGAGYHKEKYVHASVVAALQGEVSRLREAATVLRNNFRCVLSVNCNCDEEFIDRQTAEIDALLEPPTDGR